MKTIRVRSYFDREIIFEIAFHLILNIFYIYKQVYNIISKRIDIYKSI